MLVLARVRSSTGLPITARAVDTSQVSTTWGWASTAHEKIRNASRLRARIDGRIGSGTRRIRPEPGGSIGSHQEKQLDDNPSLQKGQGNSKYHEQQFLGDRNINAEIESEKKTVIRVGETINDKNCNRPQAAPVAIVKPLDRSGCVDPDHRDCDDPVQSLPLRREVKRELEPKYEPESEESQLHNEVSGAVDAALKTEQKPGVVHRNLQTAEFPRSGYWSYEVDFRFELVPQKLVDAGLGAGAFVDALDDDGAGGGRARLAILQGFCGQGPGHHDGIFGNFADKGFPGIAIDDFG